MPIYWLWWISIWLVMVVVSAWECSYFTRNYQSVSCNFSMVSWPLLIRWDNKFIFSLRRDSKVKRPPIIWGYRCGYICVRSISRRKGPNEGCGIAARVPLIWINLFALIEVFDKRWTESKLINMGNLFASAAPAETAHYMMDWIYIDPDK